MPMSQLLSCVFALIAIAIATFVLSDMSDFFIFISFALLLMVICYDYFWYAFHGVGVLLCLLILLGVIYPNDGS